MRRGRRRMGTPMPKGASIMSARQPQPRHLPGAPARLTLLATLLCSAVLVAPRASAAQRLTAAPFRDAGTVTLLRDDEATDIDPASNAVSSGGTIVGNIDDALV